MSTTFRDTIKTFKTGVTIVTLATVPVVFMSQPVSFDLEGGHDKASNVPAWTSALADRFPACEAHREGAVAPAVVVVDSGADAHRMSTDEAFALNDDGERANNVWVVGTCAA